MAEIEQKTITIRYTPASRSIIYEKRDKPLSSSDVHHMIRTLNRTRISTLAPTKPKGGEVYVYRNRIIGKTWRNDGYERCWRSNGTHYYPKFGDVEISKQNAVFRIVRHVAVDKAANNAKSDFKRVAFVELQRGKENPVIVVQYFGDETSCNPGGRPHGNTTHGQSYKYRKNRRRATVATMQRELVDSTECEIVEHMDIGAEVSGVSCDTTAAVGPVAVTAAAASLDEDLREACAQGDVDRVASLLASGANVDSANRVNGWTALHWAAKRSHAGVVSLLLGRGANPEAENLAGQTPGDLAGCEKVVRLLSGDAAAAALTPRGKRGAGASAVASAKFVPNYLRNPEFHYARRDADNRHTTGASSQQQQLGEQQPLLLQVRVANSRDPDFIEVELAHRSYADLLELLCQELGLDAASVERIRKLPNVRLRNDGDVGRLGSGQQLELVLREF